MVDQTGTTPDPRRTSLENIHKLLLEALRHREQEIFRYLAILGPALGGFVWMLYKGLPETNPKVFVAGTIGVLFLLFLGAVYALALGFNYRYITLELAKIESALNITDAMLKGWPKSPQDFRERYKLSGSSPMCIPPEVICVFWWAFLIGICAVDLTSLVFISNTCQGTILVITGIALLGLTYSLCRRYGRKLKVYCDKEGDGWADSSRQDSSSQCNSQPGGTSEERSAMSPEISPEEAKRIAELNLLMTEWKTVVKTQMHFNDMIMRARATGISVVMAVYGAAGFTVGKFPGQYLGLDGIRFHASIPIIIFGLSLLMAIYILDRKYYFRLLLGSVKRGLEIDTAYRQEQVAGTRLFGMTTLITSEVSQEQAEHYLNGFYLIPMVLGVLFLVYMSCFYSPYSLCPGS
jgi:hypothetical protein